MWTDTTWGQYARAELALPSDLTDAKWALLEAFFPAPCRVGRARTWPLRSSPTAHRSAQIGKRLSRSSFVQASQQSRTQDRKRLYRFAAENTM
jgi:hypothetical protein